MRSVTFDAESSHGLVVPVTWKNQQSRAWPSVQSSESSPMPPPRERALTKSGNAHDALYPRHQFIERVADDVA